MGQFLTGVATRIFIISLPTLAGALNTDILAISWAVIVYQLAGISLSVVFGRLGDIHGRHVIYGLGFAIMAASSLLCGLAANATHLILFRFLQGLGAAMISSATRVLALVFGATALGFLAHERRSVNPVVNLSLFKIRMFTFSILSLLLIATTTSVLGFLMPFYIQDVLHFSPSLMGLIFLAAPVFTIGLATVSGQLTDRIGPRAPASIGVLATLGAFAIGGFLRTDSHWMLPASMMALVGVGSGFFNTPNQAAIIGSVPREYRGFATGMVQTIFGISALLGISLGGALLTLAFRYYSGVDDATPSAEHPGAFVAAMNVTYFACLVLMIVALLASFLRGGTKIEAASSAGTL